jgi:hypothetical protein
MLGVGRKSTILLTDPHDRSDPFTTRSPFDLFTTRSQSSVSGHAVLLLFQISVNGEE